MAAQDYYGGLPPEPQILPYLPPPPLIPHGNYAPLPPTPPDTSSSSPKPTYFRPPKPAPISNSTPQFTTQSGINLQSQSPRPISDYSAIPGRVSTPRIHRPSSPSYSPYNASRPRPRKGFIRRVRTRLRSFLRFLAAQVAAHPIRTALLAILPAATGKWVWQAGKKVYDGVSDWLEDNAKGKGAYGGVLDEFVGFGGSRMGPLDGVLKILQMLVNHYCKLTPSSIPRLMSIFIELYFLKDMVLQVSRED